MRENPGKTITLAATATLPVGALLMWLSGGAEPEQSRMLFIAGLALAAASLFLCIVHLCSRPAVRGGNNSRLHRNTSSEPDSLMQSTWREGLQTLAKAKNGKTLPWYISFGHENRDRKNLLDIAGIPGTLPSGRTRRRGFTWHFAREAVWLDLDFALLDDGGGQWGGFLEHLGGAGKSSPIRGVTITLDTATLLSSSDTEVRKDAALIRSRIDGLIRRCDAKLPVYIMVNRIDRLYGMRSLLAGLPSEQLSEPLGSFRDPDGEHPDLFAEQTLHSACQRLRQLARIFPGKALARQGDLSSPGFAATLQAQDELSLLGKRLALFCAEAFDATPYQLTSELRGIFLGSPGVDGTPVTPSLPLSALSGRIHEEQGPEGSWFLTRLLENLLPRDPAQQNTVPAAGPAPFLRSGLAPLYAGMLVLCCLLTWSFAETRAILRVFSEKAAFSGQADDLASYLTATREVETANRNRLSPHFGMREHLRLEEQMRRRYCENYSLLILPGLVNNLREQVEATVSGGDADLMHQTVAALSSLRTGLSQPDRPTAAASALVPSLAADNDGLRLFEAYRSWSIDSPDTAKTAEALAQMEQTVLARIDRETSAPQSRILARIPSPPALATDAPLALAPPAGQTGPDAPLAMTRVLLPAGNAVQARPVNRDKLLREYREKAEALWTGRLNDLGDAGLLEHIRMTARSEDPATLLLKEIRDRLLPLFSESDGNPEIEWLRQYCRLLPDSPVQKIADAPTPHDLKLDAESMNAAFATIARLCASPETNIELIRSRYRGTSGIGSRTNRSDGGRDGAAVIDGDPFGDAQKAAEGLTRSLRDVSGHQGWLNLSPLASYQYLRYLSTRLAAVNLDEKWRNTVFHAAPMVRGAKESRSAGLPDLLNEFLAESSGFWRQEHTKLSNGVWDRMPFMFNRDFLKFCGTAITVSNMTRPATLTIPFMVNAVLVDPDARQRPVKVEFIWGGTRIRERATYRNYLLETSFTWDGESRNDAEIRIYFPGFTLVKRWEGEDALGNFVRFFESGEQVLEADDFAMHRRDLAEAGVSQIIIRARMQNYDDFLLLHDSQTLRIPQSIITPGGRKRREGMTAPENTGYGEERYAESSVFSPRTAAYQNRD